MKEEFKVDTFIPGNVSTLVEFLRKEYPQGEIADEGFLNWEYLDCPFGKAFITKAMDKQQAIASQYAVIPWQIVVDGEILKGSLSLNTLTAEGFRGKGLFVKTAEVNYISCSENGVLFTMGVPNRNSFPGFTRRLHFTHSGNLTFSMKPLRPLNILKALVRKDKVKKGGEITLVIDDNSFDSRSVSKFDPKVDHHLYESFWNEWKRRNRILVNRTSEYLSWRYLDNPLRKYHLLKIVDKGLMKGLVVFRTLNVFGMRASVVMDFFSMDDIYGKKLLDALSVVMNANRLDIMIAVSARRDGIYTDLKKSGFIKVPEFMLPQKLPLIIRMHRKFRNSELLFDLHNWHFTFGDYDIF